MEKEEEAVCHFYPLLGGLMYRTEHKSGKGCLHVLILNLPCVFSQVRLPCCSSLSLFCWLFHTASFRFSPDLGDAKTQPHRLLSWLTPSRPQGLSVARNEVKRLLTGGAVPAARMPSLLGAGSCCPAWLGALASLRRALQEAEPKACPGGDLGLEPPRSPPLAAQQAGAAGCIGAAEGGQTTFLPPSFPPHPTPW